MKKTYQKPQLETFETNEAFLLTISTVTQANKNQAVLSKGRYEDDEDDDFFVDDIWK